MSKQNNGQNRIWLYAAFFCLMSSSQAITNFGVNLSYNSGGAGNMYYPNSIFNAGASVNSLYQVGGCFPNANYNNPYMQNAAPGLYNTPPYAAYPSNYPNYLPQGQQIAMPQIPPPNGGMNRPIIAPFQGSTFVPPHVVAASYNNAPYYRPTPSPCGGACGGALIQAAPIYPVAGGPLLNANAGNQGIISAGGNTVIDLRSNNSTFDFSQGLWATAYAINGNAPNVGVVTMPQRPLNLNIGPYQTVSRSYDFYDRTVYGAH